MWWQVALIWLLLGLLAALLFGAAARNGDS
jgi:hypothetical protein